MLDCLNSEIKEAYEVWHQQKAVTPNTISIYTRYTLILWATYPLSVISEGMGHYREVTSLINFTNHDT